MVLRALAVSFQVVVPILGQPGLASLYLSDNELCTGTAVLVPTIRVLSATSGTLAAGSPPLI